MTHSLIFSYSNAPNRFVFVFGFSTQIAPTLPNRLAVHPSYSTGLLVEIKKADGKYCITGANDRTVRLWNPTSADPACGRDRDRDAQSSSSSSSWGRLPSALPMQTYADGHVHPVHSVATNRSSTVLLSASDRTLLVTDLITAQAIRKRRGHAAWIDYVTCLGGGGGDVDDSCGGGGGGDIRERLVR